MWTTRQGGFLFCHNPRTAGSSMIDVFLDLFADFTPYSADPEAPYHAQDHSTDRPPDTEGLPVIGFVRNPFARELSLYAWQAFVGRNNVRDPSGLSLMAAFQPFEAYIAFRVNQQLDEPIKRLIGTQSDFYGAVTPDILARYEDLPGAFAALPCVPTGTVLGVNRVTRMGPFHVREHYTRAAQILVAHYAAEDFERYGYDPKELPE